MGFSVCLTSYDAILQLMDLKSLSCLQTDQQCISSLRSAHVRILIETKLVINYYQKAILFCVSFIFDMLTLFMISVTHNKVLDHFNAVLF